jgi:hypothetical protein
MTACRTKIIWILVKNKGKDNRLRVEEENFIENLSDIPYT